MEYDTYLSTELAVSDSEQEVMENKEHELIEIAELHRL